MLLKKEKIIIAVAASVVTVAGTAFGLNAIKNRIQTPAPIAAEELPEEEPYSGPSRIYVHYRDGEEFVDDYDWSDPIEEKESVVDVNGETVIVNPDHSEASASLETQARIAENEEALLEVTSSNYEEVMEEIVALDEGTIDSPVELPAEEIVVVPMPEEDLVPIEITPSESETVAPIIDDEMLYCEQCQKKTLHCHTANCEADEYECSVCYRKTTLVRSAEAEIAAAIAAAQAQAEAEAAAIAQAQDQSAEAAPATEEATTIIPEYVNVTETENVEVVTNLF